MFLWVDFRKRAIVQKWLVHLHSPAHCAFLRNVSYWMLPAHFSQPLWHGFLNRVPQSSLVGCIAVTANGMVQIILTGIASIATSPPRNIAPQKWFFFFFRKVATLLYGKNFYKNYIFEIVSENMQAFFLLSKYFLWNKSYLFFNIAMKGVKWVCGCFVPFLSQ